MKDLVVLIIIDGQSYPLPNKFLLLLLDWHLPSYPFVVLASGFSPSGFSGAAFARRMAFSFSRSTFSRSSVADNREMGFGRGLLLFLV